jgi:hypothetical protein
MRPRFHPSDEDSHARICDNAEMKAAGIHRSAGFFAAGRASAEIMTRTTGQVLTKACFAIQGRGPGLKPYSIDGFYS